jgi:hypothetical protein
VREKISSLAATTTSLIRSVKNTGHCAPAPSMSWADRELEVAGEGIRGRHGNTVPVQRPTRHGRRSMVQRRSPCSGSSRPR